ncbi:DUF6127 family protein [Roseomonas sp. F4]
MSDRIHLTAPELRDLLDHAAEAGAKRALARLGLADEASVKDLAEVRDLLSAWRTARRVAWETVVRAATIAILAALAAGFALNWIGGSAPPR